MRRREGARGDVGKPRASRHGRDAVAPAEGPVEGRRGGGSRIQFNI